MNALLSGSGLREGPIPHPVESYRSWCVLVSKIQHKARVGLLKYRKKLHMESQVRIQFLEGCNLVTVTLVQASNMLCNYCNPRCDIEDQNSCGRVAQISTRDLAICNVVP